MKQLIKIFKALSDTTRIRIIKMLQRKKLCVCELQEILGLAQSSVSRHLKILEDAGLIEHEKCGQWVNYKTSISVDDPYTDAFLSHFHIWLENQTEIQKDRELMGKVNRTIICKNKK